MQRPNFPLEIFKLRSRRLSEQQNFCLSLNLSLPAIKRFNFRQNLHACSEVCTNQHVCEPRGFLAARRRHNNYNRIVIHRELPFFFIFDFILGWSTGERRRIGTEETFVELQRTIRVALVNENHSAFVSRGQQR